MDHEEPAPIPGKPKLTSEQRKIRQADRLASIRLRMAIARELEERGITTPAQIGLALNMEPGEAVGLLSRRQWREGAVAALEATAQRLGLRKSGSHHQD